jgi:hypothetical protein
MAVRRAKEARVMDPNDSDLASDELSMHHKVKYNGTPPRSELGTIHTRPSWLKLAKVMEQE